MWLTSESFEVIWEQCVGLVSYPDPNVRNDDYRLQYKHHVHTEGLANKSIEVVLVRRNVGAPIRIESPRDVTVIRFQ